VSCERCIDLCIRYAIRHPRELDHAIQIAAQNIADGTISEVVSDPRWNSCSFEKLSTGGRSGDFVEHHFRCLRCGELFWLHAETYHGSGGYWEPEDSASIRENVSN
jgi:hypothetical protein